MGTDTVTFAHRLRTLRAESGLSLRDVATLSGLPKTSLWSFEVGARVPRISRPRRSPPPMA